MAVSDLGYSLNLIDPSCTSGKGAVCLLVYLRDHPRTIHPSNSVSVVKYIKCIQHS